MVKYSAEFLDSLRGSRLSDHVGPHVTLQKRGSAYVGLCPFHDEKTPSFNVNDAKGLYYCFGCGRGGDIFDWYTDYQKLPFPEAVKEIARVSGIEAPVSGEPSKPKLRTLEVNKAALEYFTRQSHVEVVYGYLSKERRLTDDTIRKYGLGWAPDSWNALRDYLHHERGFTLQEIGKQGLINVAEEKKQSRDIRDWYSFYRNRLMIPVSNHLGDVVGFAARALTEEDEQRNKFLNNLVDTVFGKPLYDKSKVLFGLNEAWPHIVKEKKAILTEGYMHVISSHQAGMMTVVGKCGSALTEQQLQLLSQIANKVHIIEDGDDAGVKATKKEMRMMFAMGMTPSFTALNAGEDLDDRVRNLHHDRDAITQSLPRTSFVDYILSTLSYELPLKPEDESNALNEIYGFFSLERDKTKIFIYLKRIAEKLNIPAQMLVTKYEDKLKVRKIGLREQLPSEEIRRVADLYVLDFFLATGKFGMQHADISPESSFFDEDTSEFYRLLVEKSKDSVIGKQYKMAIHAQPDMFVADEMEHAFAYMKKLYEGKNRESFPHRLIAILKNGNYRYDLSTRANILRHFLRTEKKRSLLNEMVSAHLSNDEAGLEIITDKLVRMIDANGRA